MYCTKCGDNLREGGEVFVCEKGKMETSRVVAQGLREYASSETVPFEDGDTQLGGIWFCPCCGVPLREQESCLCGLSSLQGPCRIQCT